MMSVEQEPPPIPIHAIYFNLKERSLILEGADQNVIRLLLGSQGITYQVLRIPTITDRSVDRLMGDAESPPTASVEEREKDPVVTLSGRLRSTPKEGRLDRSGKPTAWARVAVHEASRSDAHVFLTTFHGRTAAIALGLEPESPITIQGYAHASADPARKRLDTLSVINILNYPGKPEKPAS